MFTVIFCCFLLLSLLSASAHKLWVYYFWLSINEFHFPLQLIVYPDGRLSARRRNCGQLEFHAATADTPTLWTLYLKQAPHRNSRFTAAMEDTKNNNSKIHLLLRFMYVFKFAYAQAQLFAQIHTLFSTFYTTYIYICTYTIKHTRRHINMFVCMYVCFTYFALHRMC